MFLQKKAKKAFTMAEAILVMTILGIIASIMITTIKPAKFKEEGLKTLAKKVLSGIDTATSQILINDSKLGTFNTLVTSTGGSTEFSTSSSATMVYYKKYLTAIRATVDDTSFCKTGGTGAVLTGIEAAFLKDGSCIGILGTTSYNNTTGYNTIFPGEESAQTTQNIAQGLIFIDINGNQEPNTLGQDCFILPIGNGGIMYDG